MKWPWVVRWRYESSEADRKEMWDRLKNLRDWLREHKIHAPPDAILAQWAYNHLMSNAVDLFTRDPRRNSVVVGVTMNEPEPWPPWINDDVFPHGDSPACMACNFTTRSPKEMTQHRLDGRCDQRQADQK